MRIFLALCFLPACGGNNNCGVTQLPEPASSLQRIQNGNYCGFNENEFYGEASFSPSLTGSDASLEDFSCCCANPNSTTECSVDCTSPTFAGVTGVDFGAYGVDNNNFCVGYVQDGMLIAYFVQSD